MFSSRRIVAVHVGPRKDRISGMWSAHNFWARITFEIKDHFFAKPREWEGLFHYHGGWREVESGQALNYHEMKRVDESIARLKALADQMEGKLT